MRLTDLSIQKLKPREAGQYTVFDDQLPGFGIRISQRSKSFVVMYGESRRLKTLGRYPTLTLKTARRDALAFIASLSPSQPHLARLGYSEACERFLEECAHTLKPKTITDYRRRLKFYGFQKPIQEVTRRDILTKLHTLSNQPVHQNHTFDTIFTFFNWALRNELIDRHPLQGEKKPNPKRHRDRVLSEDELRKVYMHAEAYGFPYGHIVRLLILTGQRRAEITYLTWDRVGETLQFPDTKNRSDHKIPLLPMARAVIESIPMTDEEQERGKRSKHFLFENTKPVPFSAFSKAAAEFNKPMDIAPYTLHDLRRTFSSTMAMLGVPLHVTERILNHKSGTISGVAAIYNRYTFAREMEDALATYEAYVAKLLQHS